MQIDYGDRMLTFCAVDYEAQPGYVPVISQATQVVKDKAAIATGNYAAGPGVHLLRDDVLRASWQFTNGRVFLHALGNGPFAGAISSTVANFVSAIEQIRPPTLKRIGFKSATFVPLKMTHPEIVKLLFGTFLPEASVLQHNLGEVNDVGLNLIGTKSGVSYQTAIAPMSAKQTGEYIRREGHLDNLVEDRWADNFVRQFVERVSVDCLAVDVDVFVTDQVTTGLSALLLRLPKVAAEITDEVVARIKGTKVY